MFKGLRIRYIATLLAVAGLLVTAVQPHFSLPSTTSHHGLVAERGPIESMDIRGGIHGESIHPGAGPTGAAPIANQKIAYNGGPVMGGPINIYLIWYGAWTDPTRTSPTSGESIITDYFNNIGASNRNMINSAYRYATAITGTNVVLKQQVAIPASATFGTSNGTVLGTTGVTSIVSSAIANSGLPSDVNGLYFVLTAAGVSETSGANSSFLKNYCGYHSYLKLAAAPSTRLKYSFVGNPAGASLASCNGQPGATSPNGNPGVDAMISVLQHELEETMTDPELNAFWDSATGSNTGNENSDICAWTFGSNISNSVSFSANMSLGSRQYWVQQNWYPGTTTSTGATAAFTGGSCLSALPTAASVTSFAPTTATRGSVVTVTGTNFGSASGVKVNGVSASFTPVSATSITLTVPATATDGYIEVTTPSGAATSNTKLVVPPMALTSFAPGFGQAGASVTLSGSQFTGASSVTFNGSPASFTVNNDTTITATVPLTATSGVITVVAPAGTVSSTVPFVLTTGPAPVITSLSATSGFARDSIVIAGSNFTGTTSVTFNGFTASFTENSASQLTVLIPVGATSGLIKVSTATGGWVFSAASFTVKAPTITSFTPVTGSSGTQITITGTNFVGVTAVTFNGVNATSFSVSNATTILATAPVTGATGKVTVVSDSGSATSATNFSYPVPTLTSFTPATAARGATVTITGTNFSNAFGVTFNGVSATSFSVVSATQITAVIPDAATTGRIAVVALGGTVTSATNLTVSAPTLTSFTQSVAVGTTVTIFGTNLIGVTGVTFNTTKATSFTVVSSTQISAVVPAGTTAGRLSITSASGTVTSTGSFTLALPTVTTVNPSAVTVGSSVILTGTNFVGVTAVKFGTASAITYTVNSATQITVTVPAGVVASSVFVTTQTGTNTTGRAYTLAVPTVTAVAPTTVAVGTRITITGTNFTGATAVKFGTVNAPNFTVVSATSITVTVPSGIVASTVTVTTPTGPASAGSAYTVSAVSVTNVSLSQLATGSANTVVITGTGLTGAATVRFNGVAATSTTVTATTITAVSGVGVTAGSITFVIAGVTYTLPPYTVI